MIGFYELDQINDAIHDSESGATVKLVIRLPDAAETSWPVSLPRFLLFKEVWKWRKGV
ncbi:MAG: hypothetical protein M0Z65_15800 [Firmicutes bacterium]|uniref:hypothetical protein n=1 Tax=Melghirimyces thermohalophilus TaxID=1236220 RepID=UPI0015A24066|nr:hypothetical protein [Melghirimyces thermohalophilus]MDA8354616.1 hypothetical protein [Bacillota bacterium]